MSANKQNWFARHKVLSVILALILVGIIAGAASSSNKPAPNSANKNTASSNKTDKTQLAKIGQPARDGKFEFIVKNIECGRVNIGSDFLTKSAQGQYCLLTVNVKNIGNERQSLFSTNQKLLDSSNREFSADDQATLYASPQGSTASWYNDINPGNSVEGAIVFDIPKDIKPVAAELHDSAFSNGVKISL